MDLPGEHSLEPRDNDNRSNTKELVIFSVGERIAACRFLDGGEDASVHLSSWQLFQLIPGEILTLEIRKTWNYRKQLHVSGKMLAHESEISRLDLTPLRLTDQGEWDPHEFFEEEKRSLPARLKTSCPTTTCRFPGSRSIS